tara:strand:- start:1575 stop:2552 length:978 start_codon:yes stop_codon:yes gene_type:complete
MTYQLGIYCKKIFKKIKGFNCLNGKTSTSANEQTDIVFLPQYKDVRLLGIGGTSTVYKVIEQNTNKLYTRKNVYKGSSAIREVHVLKRLPKNRFFPVYIDMISNDITLSIITEYINGIELFEWFVVNYQRKKEQLPYNAFINILIELVYGVKTLNQSGYSHLDIKLENIIIQDSPQPEAGDMHYKLVLIDYGMAHTYTTELGKLGCACGTIGYTPLEIYQGFYTANSDIWSMGVCFWILITGEQPFKHTHNMRQVTGKSSIKRFLFPNKRHLHCKRRFKINDDLFSLLIEMFQISYKDRICIDNLLYKLNAIKAKGLITKHVEWI